MQDVTDIARRYADRADLARVPCVSAWNQRRAEALQTDGAPAVAAPAQALSRLIFRRPSSDPMPDAPALNLLVFGGGYVGAATALEAIRRGGRAVATSRDPERRRALEAEGITALDPGDAAALKTALEAADAVLITAAARRPRLSPPARPGAAGRRRLARLGWAISPPPPSMATGRAAGCSRTAR